MAKRSQSAGTPSAGLQLPKAHRLLKRFEFVRAAAEGRRIHAPHFIFVLVAPLGPRQVEGQPAAMAPAPLHHPRLGITVTKRIGNAAKRNRIKRLVREVFRRVRASYRPCDLVVIAKAGAADLTLDDVAREFSRLDRVLRV